jgi:VanZ family protein
MNFLRYIPMIMVMGIIFFLSAQTGDSLDLPDIPDLDKVLHAVAYAVLALTVLYAVPGEKYRGNPWRVSLLVVLFCLLYGMSDEFHQSFVPKRMPSALDLAADTCGAVLAVVVWYRVIMRRRAGRLRA